MDASTANTPLDDVTTQNIINALWQTDENGQTPNVFAVIDCARDKKLEPMINNSKLPHECLYAGKLSYALKRAAPHVVKLKPDSEFTYKFIREGWGKSWGIFYITSATVNLALVRNGCRRIAKVQAPGGKTLVFRYYDPRVMRCFIDTSDDQQNTALVGAASKIIVEGERLGIVKILSKNLDQFTVTSEYLWRNNA